MSDSPLQLVERSILVQERSPKTLSAEAAAPDPGVSWPALRWYSNPRSVLHSTRVIQPPASPPAELSDWERCIHCTLFQGRIFPFDDGTPSPPSPPCLPHLSAVYFERKHSSLQRLISITGLPRPRRWIRADEQNRWLIMKREIQRELLMLKHK